MAALLVLGVLASLVGVAIWGVPGDPGSQTGLTGLRTDPDGRGVVVTYGGGCERSHRLTARETTGSVALSLYVDGTGLDCAASHQTVTARVRLRAPLGSRAIMQEGRPLVPFDGTRLLQPTALPTGLQTLTADIAYAPFAPAPVVTTTWGRTWSILLRDFRCPPGGRGTMTLVQGPPAPPPRGDDPGSRSLGTRDVGGATAQLRVRRLAHGPGASLSWSAAGGSVTLRSEPGCGRPLSPDELLAVARSLRGPG